ncbi:hypothetical protein KSP39_PZI013664 [Platanthera zijinensis]|uniref:Uncharacterized protein n=1 Tax=Platanthera zijinensis TaxID=2320716 RepID=A0AAP0G2V0_9ASPA
MCLKTTEVCNARIKCLVETVITVLDSSISCKILLLGREGPEFLQVGSSISFGDGRELVRVGADMLENLQANTGFVHALLHAFLRTAVSSSIHQVPFIRSSMRDQGTETAGISRRTAIASLMRFSSDKIYSSHNETPLRLLFWHLDPLLFKNDISEVLRETMERPFLSLEAEFYNRPTWRSMILCLVTSPAMFRQASILLHNWFLRTGVTFVLELQIALVSAVLDMISRPMTWGISMEMGLKYPFMHAYFPSSSQKLLGRLTGSISRNSFIDLVHCIKVAVTGAEASMDPSICYSSFRHETILDWIENNSTWSMLMKFPIWFYFAIMLIFYYKNIQDLYISKVISTENSFDSSNDEELNKAAIIYLSFVLSPVDKGHGDGVAEHLLRISRSWRSTVSAFSFHKEGSFLGSSHNKSSLSWNKKFSINKDYDGKLASWLRKFDAVCVNSWTKSFLGVSLDSKCDGKNFTTSKKLFNQIPLGILILYPGMVSDSGCELLLFYATTGEILQFGGHENIFVFGKHWKKMGS